MKYPICTFDARSGVLCPNCEAKLREGKISQVDVDVSVKLAKLSENNAQLQRFSLQRAIKLNNRHYILVFGDNQVSQLEAMPQLLEGWRSQLSGKVWLVENSYSDRKLLESLISPARIATVNTIWLPNGEKLLKPVFEHHKRRHHSDYEEDIPRERATSIREAVRALRGVDVLIGPTLTDENLDPLREERREELVEDEANDRKGKPESEEASSDNRIAMPA